MAKAGTLLWNRKRFLIQAQGSTDIDTGLKQVNLNVDAPEPPLGINEPGATPPAPGSLPASRVMVIPLAPTGNWFGVAHSEPYFDEATGTIHVSFTSQEGFTEVNCLFWDPHSIVGPGQADTYNPPIEQ